MKKILLLTVLLFCFFISGFAQKNTIKMATTTSTQSSGFLDYILPIFKEKTEIEIQVIAVGSGKAIKLGENGDVDLVFVHSRKDEDEFVSKGYGINRKDVMYNDFVILGPKTSNAKVDLQGSLTKVLQNISTNKLPFISRGDESGTHKKELDLWKKAGINTKQEWYILAGQGMGEVLIMANEKMAYTLSDRATYLAYENKIDLKIICEGDKELFNPYGVIAVNPAKYKDVKYNDSMSFINWIVSKEGQLHIADFKINGKEVFYPMAK